MGTLDEELAMDSETVLERRARELVEADLDLIAALRRARGKRGWSQKELARQIGISQETVCEFEGNQGDTKLSTIRRYALALGVDIAHSALVDGEPRPHSSA